MTRGTHRFASMDSMKIAIENGHRNSGFTHKKWWFSIVNVSLLEGIWVCLKMLGIFPMK